MRIKVSRKCTRWFLFTLQNCGNVTSWKKPVWQIDTSWFIISYTHTWEVKCKLLNTGIKISKYPEKMVMIFLLHLSVIFFLWFFSAFMCYLYCLGSSSSRIKNTLLKFIFIVSIGFLHYYANYTHHLLQYSVLIIIIIISIKHWIIIEFHSNVSVLLNRFHLLLTDTWLHQWRPDLYRCYNSN